MPRVVAESPGDSHPDSFFHEVVGKANADILHTPEDVVSGKPEEIREAALQDGY